MKKIIILTISIAFLCIAVLFAGCSTQSPDSSPQAVAQAVQGNVIHLSGGDSGYPQPFTIYPRGPGSSKVNLIFDSLVEKDEKGLIPWLAKDWNISQDGKEYTFTLRDGVVWQDGTPFTAKDVKFTFDYEQKNVPVSGGIEEGLISEVQVIDDHTVKFILGQPVATFLYKLNGFKIIPEHVYATVSDPVNFIAAEAVTGTGPYTLGEYNKEHGSYRFVANEKFWGPKQAIQTIEFIPVSDALISFEQKEIDFTSVTPDTLDRYTNNPDIRIVQQPAFWGYEFYFNMNKRPELKDSRIRKAFAYAIDRDELVEKIQRGAGKTGNMGILPDDHIWYNPDQPEYKHDIAQANELLNQTGWKDSDNDGIRDLQGQKLSYTLIVGSDETRIGELIRERLKEAGIDLQIKALESKSRDTNLKKGDFELLISGFGGWGQDADYLRTRYCGNMTTMTGSVAPAATVYGYSNPALDELATREIAEQDENARKQLIFEMQKVLAEDIPTIPLFYTTSNDAWYISRFDGWMNMFDHHARTQSKLSYLNREGIAAKR